MILQRNKGKKEVAFSAASNHDAHWFTVPCDGIPWIGIAKRGGNVRGAEPYFPVNFQCPDASELGMFKY